MTSFAPGTPEAVAEAVTSALQGSSAPSATRGSAGSVGGGGNGQLAFPAREFPLYTNLQFFKYGRDVAQGKGEREPTVAIRLPIPLQYADADSLNFNAGDNIHLRTIEEALTRAGNAESVREGAGAIAAGISSAITGGIGDISSKLGAGDNVNAAATLVALNPRASDSIGFVGDARTPAEQIAGTIRNPHTTLAFKGTNIKNYQFQFKCSPRSSSETDSLVNIIRMIKEKIYPSIDESLSPYALDYPNLVEISFPGTMFPQTGVCFVTDFTVAHNGSGQGFYQGGGSIDYTLTLSVTETEARTRETANDFLNRGTE